MKTLISLSLLLFANVPALAENLGPRIFDTAMVELGVRELGPGHDNPRIQTFFTALTDEHLSDTTPWCSAFAAFIVTQSGGDVDGITLAARSWQKYGTKVKTPAPGDIVILWRGHPNSWMGHVGFYVGETDSTVIVLGGNQSDSVSIAEYPKTKVLALRRVSGTHAINR